MGELEPLPLKKYPIKGTVRTDVGVKGVPQELIDETARQLKEAQERMYSIQDSELDDAIEIEKKRRDLKTIQAGGETPSENAKYVIGGVVVSLVGIASWLIGCFK